MLAWMRFARMLDAGRVWESARHWQCEDEGGGSFLALCFVGVRSGWAPNHRAEKRGPARLCKLEQQPCGRNSAWTQEEQRQKETLQ